MTDSTTNGNGTFQSITRHSDYYIPGGDLSILVEHTQFRVHKFFFERESKWFKEHLVQPASPGSTPQGSSDANAFILENLTPAQFAKFLWVFYNPRHSLYERASLEDWETILRLSERWKFPEVKGLSVRELEKKDLTDVKRIKLYQENNVDRNFLIPRYAALCEREEPLTLAEGIDLGMETALQISSARERARLSLLPSGARSPSTPTVRGDGLRDIIRELFKIDAPTGTTEENTTNSGALKTPPKPQEQQAKPPPPAKNSTEKQKNQTQNGKKGEGKTVPLTTPTTTTPTTETKPPPPTPAEKPQQPPKEEEGEAKAKEEGDGNKSRDGNQVPKDGEPASTVATDSSATTQSNPAAADNADKSSVQPPSDSFSFSLFEKSPPFSSSSNNVEGSVFGNASTSLFGDWYKS